MNQRLLGIAMENEVREALFMMHPEKAPGPDSMTTLFFFPTLLAYYQEGFGGHGE